MYERTVTGDFMKGGQAVSPTFDTPNNAVDGSWEACMQCAMIPIRANDLNLHQYHWYVSAHGPDE